MNEYKHLFSGKQEPALIDVPSLPYLMVDGKGAPDSPEYSNAVSRLYAVAYSVRAALKTQVEYSVFPLQGQWWSPDPAVFAAGDRDAWQWTMMILQPARATAEIVASAMAKAARKRPVEGVRFEEFTEGTCAQILHKGPYSAEPPTIARLMDFVRQEGRQLTGKHHEIYLTRPRTDAPDKMRTLIRYPV
ncbi:GyrI-like domain-containing protein [Kibdelosporangium philippinense]|uniref:GyrI-like domain-containing protein n=1 Tax=Kibdelosporangium philippinense TaxID=211113 RepID=A0ABS8ZWP1_9PSEU|nr:GyrI-like domain-containing protein [Kibdelosporangium philippinense]MCE7012107.1 GyrI-like domain-containing protein [Kibdelosporangium philippinense]